MEGGEGVISRAPSSMWADQSVCRVPNLIRSAGLIKSYRRTETPHTNVQVPTSLTFLAGEIISDAPLPLRRPKVVCVRATRGTSKVLIKESVISSEVNV